VIYIKSSTSCQQVRVGYSTIRFLCLNNSRNPVELAKNLITLIELKKKYDFKGKRKRRLNTTYRKYRLYKN
jgi:hypothetical protein